MVERATVRVWHEEEGWGVLDSAGTPGGCWTHFSAIDMPGYRSLRAGQDVELTWESPGQDGYDFRATCVRPQGWVRPQHRPPAHGGSAYRSKLTITFDPP